MKLKSGIYVISGVVALFAVFWFLGGRAVTAELVYPIENAKVSFSRGAAIRFKALFSRISLAKENERLRHENESLKVELNSLDEMRSENKRLRLALQYQLKSNGRWISAPVISRYGAEGDRGIVKIGKGSLAGMKEGDVVACAAGLVGRIESVSPHTATVRLITDPSVRVSCDIVNGNAAYGRTRGILFGGNDLRIGHIKRSAVLPSGARVVTSGIGGVYPAGINVGYLADGTRVDETGLECEAYLEPAVDFSAMEDVFVYHEG